MFIPEQPKQNATNVKHIRKWKRVSSPVNSADIFVGEQLPRHEQHNRFPLVEQPIHNRIFHLSWTFCFLALALAFALAALAVCSLFTLVEYARGLLVLPSPKGGIIVLYCAIFPSILSQTFFMRGVELAGANRAGLYVNLVPVFAAFLAVMLLGEIMQPYHMLALIAVVLGIYLAERGKPS